MQLELEVSEIGCQELKSANTKLQDELARLANKVGARSKDTINDTVLYFLFGYQRYK